MVCRHCPSSSGPARSIGSWLKPCVVSALCVMGSSSAVGFGQQELLPEAFSGGRGDGSRAQHPHFTSGAVYAAAPAPATGMDSSATYSLVPQQQPERVTANAVARAEGFRRLDHTEGHEEGEEEHEEGQVHDSHEEGEDHDSHEEGEEHDEEEGEEHDSHEEGEEGEVHDSHEEGEEHDSHEEGEEGEEHDSHEEGEDHDSHEEGEGEGADHTDHDSHDHDEEHDSHDDVARGGVEGEADSHDGHDHGDEEELATAGGVVGVSVDGNKPWGRAIGAALLVNLATLVGVIFLGPGSKLISARGEGLSNRCNGILFSFAAGALLAAAFFLLLLESSHLLEGVYEEENEVSWRWGTSILAGYMVSFVGDVLTSAFLQYGNGSRWSGGGGGGGSSLRTLDISASNVPRRRGRSVDTATAETTSTTNATTVLTSSSDPKMGHAELPAATVTAVAADEEAGQTLVVMSALERQQSVGVGAVRVFDEEVLRLEKPMPQRDIQTMMRVRFGVLVGDFFHNFVDGVFIGAAFMLCGEAKGWTIAAGTIYHELAQEFADFFTLTGIGGMTACSALALNFVSGLSVVLGVIVVLASDVSNAALGVLLAFGGGVYIHVAATESLPKVYGYVQTLQDRIYAFLAFVIGATTIGLVLLDHDHCQTGAHDGHNH